MAQSKGRRKSYWVRPDSDFNVFEVLSISLCSLASAFSYGVASMAMVFVNKAVLMQYVHSMTLLTLQVLLSITAEKVLHASMFD